MDYEKLLEVKIEHVTKNGNKKIITRLTDLFRDNYGFIPGVLSSKKDITERKKTEEELKKFKNVSDNANYGIGMIEIDGTLTYANNYFANIHGYEPDDILGKNFAILHNDDQLKRIIELKEKLEGEGSYHSEEVWHMHKNGSIFPTLMNGVSIKDEKGEMFLAATVIDISNQYEAKQKLKESESKYRGLVNNISDIIYELDINGKCSYVSHQLLDISGFSPEEMIGQNVFKFVHPDDLTKVVEEVKIAFNSDDNRYIEFRLRHKDGPYVQVSSRFSSISIGEKQKLTGVLVDVTEHKNAKENLLREKNFTETALNAQRDTFFVFDPYTGKAVRWNKAFREVTGYSDEEISSMKAPESYYNEEDLKRAAEATLQIETSAETTVEMDLITKKGTSIPFEYIGSSIKDEHGNLKYIVSIGRDITKRKKAKQKLNESEIQYRRIANELEMILDHIPGLVFYKDKNNNIILINQNVVDYYNSNIVSKGTKLTKKDFEGRSGFELLPKDISQAYWDDDLEVINSGKPKLNIEETFETEKGTRWGVTNKIPYVNENGETIGIIGFSMDITEKKKAEQRLKESEEKYRHLFESSPNAIILLNKKEIILDCNLATERIFGYNKEDLIGRHFIDLGILTVDQISYIRETYKKILVGREAKPIELQIKSKKGDLIWVNFQISLILLDGEVLIESIGQVITEKKRAEELIKEENKRLLELDQMRKELITRVSHELKTPLTSIFSCSDLLLEHYTERIDDDILRFIEIIHRGGRRLKELVENLLDASQIDSGKLNVYKDKTNLVKIIKNCIKHIEYLAAYRNHSLNIDLPEEMYLEVDETRIKQVLANLISNAIKNTPSNGNIDVSLKKNGTYGYISIKDTGVGFTEKEMEKIFKKFGKIERYGKQLDVDIEGAGLGLYISKEIVNLHDGQIWVESEGRNKGSTFIIKLPIIKIQD